MGSKGKAGLGDNSLHKKGEQQLVTFTDTPGGGGALYKHHLIQSLQPLSEAGTVILPGFSNEETGVKRLSTCGKSLSSHKLL